MERFAHIAAPMTELLSPKVPFVWGDRQQAAFEQLKHILCNAPVLLLPDWDRPFVVQCDASDRAVGAVLLQ